MDRTNKMLHEAAAPTGTERKIFGSMSIKKILLMAFAWICGAASVYAISAMFTQAMLGGASLSEIYWDRVYIWWVDFLAAGFLILLAVYLWRRARRVDQQISIGSGRQGVLRVALFPLGHVFLTICLYFVDFAVYTQEQGTMTRQHEMFAAYVVAAACAIGAAVALWRWAYKLKTPTSREIHYK